MHTVHRGPDGFIPLARKRDGQWENLGAMPVNEPWLPELLDALDTDSYFGLNSDYRPALRRERPAHERHVYRPAVVEGQHVEVLTTERVTRRVSPATGLPYHAHATHTLRWLNVAHVDVDCYRVGLSVGDALGRMVDMQDAGQLPPATGFARSGRGLWAFWFLLDVQNPRTGTRLVHGVTHGPHTPQRASTRMLAFYAKVQRALADRLLPLGADLGALDAARFAPVPGTLKTLTGQRVTWLLHVAPNGRGYAYTLPELARALGVPVLNETDVHPVLVEALPATPDGTPAKNATKSAAGKKGWRVRWRNTLADFHVLLNLRGGGFDAGCRNTGAFLYALVLKHAGYTLADVESHVATFGARCRPALTADEIRRAVRQAQKAKSATTGYVRNERLFAELGVTDTEASYFRHTSRPVGTVVPSHKPNPDERRTAIRELVHSLGRVPPTRDMADVLKSRGYEANFTTVARDYQKLGLATPKAAGGRPPKLPLG